MKEKKIFEFYIYGHACNKKIIFINFKILYIELLFKLIISHKNKLGYMTIWPINSMLNDLK